MKVRRSDTTELTTHQRRLWLFARGGFTRAAGLEDEGVPGRLTLGVTALQFLDRLFPFPSARFAGAWHDVWLCCP